MTERIVFFGCCALALAAAMIPREGAQVTLGAKGNAQAAALVPSTPAWPTSAPTTDTWNAQEATDALVVLKRGGCIEWDSIDGRVMTCGDTVPAVTIVSWERRYVQ